jgi:TRAP-type C4-dicarboxylate transport system permease small subunit
VRTLQAICQRLEAALRGVLFVLTAAMTLTVFWQVLSRLLSRLAVRFGIPALVAPSRWTEELAGFQLGWLALLGAVYAFRRREHLGFELFYSRMTPAGRRAADVFGAAAVLAFSLMILVFGGLRLVSLTLELGQTTAALQWPMGVVYVVIPVSGALMALFAVEALIARVGPPAPGEPSR